MKSLLDRIPKLSRREWIIVAALVALALVAVGAVVAFGGSLGGSRGTSEPGSVAAASPSPLVSPADMWTGADGSAPSSTRTKEAGDAAPAAASGAASGSRSEGGGEPAADATSASTGKPRSRRSASSASKPRPKPKPTKTPTVRPPSSPHFVVSGKVAKKTYFTVARLKKMKTVSAKYFSRGKDPKEETNAFVGVRLIDILKVAGLSRDAKRVRVTASDAYTASFTIRQVKAFYSDENRWGVDLPMIIAYAQDGKAYTGGNPFRLVMGQSMEGDYNRQFWVKMVVTVAVE